MSVQTVVHPIAFTPELLTSLAEVASLTERSVDAVVRVAVREYLSRRSAQASEA